MYGISDLHLHLDGSLRPSTVVDLSAKAGLAVPKDLLFQPGMGLAAALARFSYTLSLLRTPAAVRRVASEICEDAAQDGVTDLEIRFAPQLHLDEPARAAGFTEAAILDAALVGVRRRAGVIVCGIYGEEPEILEMLVELAATRSGVVGVDLAGGPTPLHRRHMVDYQSAFRQAARLGLGRTVHAGEGRPPSEIRAAIEVLGAQRIGHGTTLLADESVAALVRESGVVMEVCITSNVHTGVIAQPSLHPLPSWLQQGIRATICTDNTLLSDVTASSEYALARSLPGMTDAMAAQLVSHGHAARFHRFSPIATAAQP
jgi:adenosine deaminase